MSKRQDQAKMPIVQWHMCDGLLERLEACGFNGAPKDPLVFSNLKNLLGRLMRQTHCKCTNTDDVFRQSTSLGIDGKTQGNRGTEMTMNSRGLVRKKNANIIDALAIPK